jgi:hypothetical protein
MRVLPDGTLAYEFDRQRIIVEPGHESYGTTLKIATEIVLNGKWEHYEPGITGKDETK